MTLARRILTCATRCLDRVAGSMALIVISAQQFGILGTPALHKAAKEVREIAVGWMEIKLVSGKLKKASVEQLNEKRRRTNLVTFCQVLYKQVLLSINLPLVSRT